MQETKQKLLAPLTAQSLSDYHLGLAQGTVAAFMSFAGQQVRTVPTGTITPEEKIRIGKVFSEEFREFFEAMERNDLVEVVDGLADIIYVALSIAATYGIFLAPVVREVCNNNHLKTLSPRRTSPEGKLLKPEGHQPPRIKELLDLMSNVSIDRVDSLESVDMLLSDAIGPIGSVDTVDTQEQLDKWIEQNVPVVSSVSEESIELNLGYVSPQRPNLWQGYVLMDNNVIPFTPHETELEDYRQSLIQRGYDGAEGFSLEVLSNIRDIERRG